MTKTERLMLSVSAALLTLDATGCTPKHAAGTATSTPSPSGYTSTSHGAGYGAYSHSSSSRQGTVTSGSGQGVVTTTDSSQGNFFTHLFGSFGHHFHHFG